MKLDNAVSQHSALTQNPAAELRVIKVFSHFFKAEESLTDCYEHGELKLSHVTSNFSYCFITEGTSRGSVRSAR